MGGNTFIVALIVVPDYVISRKSQKQKKRGGGVFSRMKIVRNSYVHKKKREWACYSEESAPKNVS